MRAREYLKAQVQEDNFRFFGGTSDEEIEQIVDNWMNDQSRSANVFNTINTILPSANKILDMASGCGTGVFYGLLNGFDMWGIDPEEWKHVFIRKKAEEHGYPEEWLDRFYKGVGENLPFSDSSFDCVMSWYTLEHVQDLKACIKEMIRVTKPGGGVYIVCPNYIGTFEPHYMIPWLPLLPKNLAKAYLGFRNKPVEGLKTLMYVTPFKIQRILEKISIENSGLNFEVIDVHYLNFLKRTGVKKGWKSKIKHQRAKLSRSWNIMFKDVNSINLFIKIHKK